MGEANLNTLRQQLASQLALHSEVLFTVLYGSAAEGGSFRDLDDLDTFQQAILNWIGS